MSSRAAIILLVDDRIALIERQRAGLHYFTFPGGHVEPGETPELAAVRETMEELGLDISLRRCVAEMQWQEQSQFYFLADYVDGAFGTGTGQEMHHPLPERGTYKPVWVPLRELLHLPVLPRSLAKLVVNAQSAGWPDSTPVLLDNEE